MADFDTTEFRATRFSRSASERITNRSFPVVMRGYDRAAVDSFVQEVLELVRDLEGRQSQESVVQRAIEEVGEETASILQRAHETADEIAARSRAQAGGRIQRAEREAELLRQEADAYSEKIVVDTRLLWEERQRLIEDIRQLADDVLGTADDAIERLKLPEGLETAEEAEPVPVDDGTETVALGADVEPEPYPDDPEPTEPFRLGAVADEPASEPADPPPAEEHGHTVELEALPGGSEDPPRREHD